MYDYVIVGSGLFGVVFAHEMKKAGRKCLVLERRPHVGGNVYCEEKEASASIATVPISSIRRIKKFGTTSISSSSLIITSIRRSPIIKVSSTTCLLI